MGFAKLFLFICMAIIVSSELVQFKPCYYSGQNGKQCTVSDVEIEPCPEAARNEPCKIKRGEFASIGFKYTLDFEPVEPLKTRAYWATVLADLPFVGMDTDLCKVTECPVVKGVQKSYNYSLAISKSFPAQKFDIKCKIWEENKGPERECCFMFKIRLI
ncbi:NPC intracellular cholesterol transporter 2 [Halyomorpha halys]|uniref:NPC intracellular cholesterol transporter 2 n=1 Tax=Halyomorpha halys TaxID=286706 RepID=UPI0006D4F777